MNTRKPLLIAAISVTGLVGLAATPASAAETDSEATFTLTGAGGLSLTVAPGDTLENSVSGDTAITGSLGEVEVSDLRGSTAGWNASARSSTFENGLGSISTDVTYTTGTVAKTGTSDAAGIAVAAGIMDDEVLVPVAAADAVVGNNTATWTPSISVTLPADALAGDYTGTVTTSVL